MEETTSVHWKAVAFIRAFTLSRMLEIKTGVNSLSILCLWKMVVLVGILMLNRLPLTGGEPGVQITKLIIILACENTSYDVSLPTAIYQ